MSDESFERRPDGGGEEVVAVVARSDAREWADIVPFHRPSEED